MTRTSSSSHLSEVERRRVLGESSAERARTLLGIADTTDEAIKESFFARGIAVAPGEFDLRCYSHVPGVADALESRSLRAFVADHARSVVRALDASDDGRVHAEWIALGTKTGLITCREPSLTNIPRYARHAFIPSKGNVFVCVDFSCAQLRIVGQFLKNVFHDSGVADVFARGGDPHRVTAARIFGVSYDDVSVDQRNAAKVPNFGLLYGMTPIGLVEYAASMNIALSLPEATHFRDAFFAAYPGVHRWHEQFLAVPPPVTYSLGGRICHHSGGASLGSRLAAPIQGSQADAIKTALVLLAEPLARLGAAVVIVIYDELVVEVPSAHAEEARSLIKDAMERALRTFLPDVPVIANADIRQSWAKE
ncbi:MAG TPA: DNA polymerase [Polyangiaceae bacterium]|nr:DNA polymerase [Polyangiaceae bacterium]